MVIYISKEQAIEVHRKTIEYSGGGDYGIINIGFYLCLAAWFGRPSWLQLTRLP